MRHNKVRDFEANLLSKLCNDVETEPPLQPITGEVVRGLQGDNSRPDIRAKGFWRPFQNAFFDVQVTNPNSNCYQHQPSEVTLIQHEQTKKRNYNDRIMNIEHGTFTPLIFSINGGMGPEARVYHMNLALKIAEKSGECYSKIMTWMRCKLRFLILRACLTCLRGSRQHNVRNDTDVVDDFGIALHDARLTV